MIGRLFLDHPASFKTGANDTIRALNDRLVRTRGNDSIRNGGWVI